MVWNSRVLSSIYLLADRGARPGKTTDLPIRLSKSIRKIVYLNRTFIRIGA